MIPVHFGCVVEGHGEVKALPVLLRRIVAEMDSKLDVRIAPPIRRPRGSLIQKEGELERAVELAALKVRPRGCILILLDSDDDCAAEMAPKLVRRATQSSMGLPVGVVLAEREFEAWFVAAAESLRGQRGLPHDLSSPSMPQSIRGAKEWLSIRMAGQRYSETIDQPAFASAIDLKQARSASSFDKCYREVRRLIETVGSGPRRDSV